ncbi:MAG: 8-amino-7-oxononanoate synthase [Proteobacteria bacterium]|nr:8-amino-7-oxononanoate synthase [Pseudomonadota bacterium]
MGRFILNIDDEINWRKSKGLYRSRRIIESAQGPTVLINDQEYLNFSSNDYLGLANNQELKDCMIEAVKTFGIGAASSQLIVGHFKAHEQLEKNLAKFLNRDAALVFSTGYQANLAIASVLIDSNTVILQDKLNHASLIDAALLSKGKLVRYKHRDVNHLLTLLEKYKDKDLIVMTDGVFSMDGDLAPLEKISDLCKTYNALLLVDDAHGLGAIGETGAGLLECLSLNQEQVPVLIGTFGKAFGSGGAFIAGNNKLIDVFIQKARSYIYTTALLPAVAVTVDRSIELVKEASGLRQNLKSLIKYFTDNIKQANYSSAVSNTHIQPIIIGEAEEANKISNYLYNNKIIATAIRPPTVPEKTSRLRISLTAKHTTAQIDTLLNTIKQMDCAAAL